MRWAMGDILDGAPEFSRDTFADSDKKHASRVTTSLLYTYKFTHTNSQVTPLGW